MNEDCTENIFLEDIKNHEMSVLRNDGLSRHLRFKRPNSAAYFFDLITWNGHLCITGDMGTYVFSRIDDMFEFFRVNEDYAKHHSERKLFINTGYWGEKLLSISRNGGYEEFSPESFKECINKDFEEWEFEDKKQKAEVWEDIERDILSCIHDGDVRAYDAVNGFKSDYGHEFIDFWEHSFTEFTFHYIWCLYAIVYGISLYDEIAKPTEQGENND